MVDFDDIMEEGIDIIEYIRENILINILLVFDDIYIGVRIELESKLESKNLLVLKLILRII